KLGSTPMELAVAWTISRTSVREGIGASSSACLLSLALATTSSGYVRPINVSPTLCSSLPDAVDAELEPLRFNDWPALMISDDDCIPFAANNSLSDRPFLAAIPDNVSPDLTVSLEARAGPAES